jgi:hypothetical protein
MLFIAGDVVDEISPILSTKNVISWCTWSHFEFLLQFLQYETNYVFLANSLVVFFFSLDYIGALR